MYAQCWRTRMTRRSVGSRYSSISLGASMLRHNLDSEVLTKVPKLVAAGRAG